MVSGERVMSVTNNTDVCSPVIAEEDVDIFIGQHEVLGALRLPRRRGHCVR